MNKQKTNRIEIKICGLTIPEQAKEIASLGADAIGLVFFTRSPRNVTTEQAQEIISAINNNAKTCGVFVDMDLNKLIGLSCKTNLDILQLHGNESAEYIRELKKETGKKIIKVLKTENFAVDAPEYPADFFLLELGKGALPGGNAQTWNWHKAANFGLKYPYILAGGLSPENILEAITKANPKAVDLSSAVEKAPGIKNLNLVKEFINKVSSTDTTKHNERIF